MSGSSSFDLLDEWLSPAEADQMGLQRGGDATPENTRSAEPYTLHDPLNDLELSPGDGVYPRLSRNTSSASASYQVSRTFNLDARIRNTIPDIALISSDNMYFYVHSFAPLLVRDVQVQVQRLEDNASVLNIILHTVYNMSCAIYAPTFDDLAMAVERMLVYGMDPRAYIIPSNPTFSILLSHAPARPLDVYGLAAEHEIFELAASASSHLIGYDLTTLDDDFCARIGSTYLARLHNLQLYRIVALKHIIIAPPNRHPDTPVCNSRDQDGLYASWARAVAITSRDARPEVTPNLLILDFRAVRATVSCDDCKRSLDERILTMARQWAAVKVITWFLEPSYTGDNPTGYDMTAVETHNLRGKDRSGLVSS
ncbi:hypothetical protein CYLTODRAFT_414265 [Cylindrobasidium torrendii FP15055 ss-10]|uniref:Uncharacterized protein n=1 Tax=Cylindrobasidium torrendii FP15055 ss-10 TaxID=1314674 RepID=A0A0D7B0Q8_9AGAR|nr:hypothetical protein CYLTODRAFT_414265 [Cylindrobasidium torrendii FP15055 ss-10]